jgi:hypothetical protein
MRPPTHNIQMTLTSSARATGGVRQEEVIHRANTAGCAVGVLGVLGVLSVLCSVQRLFDSCYAAPRCKTRSAGMQFAI